MAGGTPSSLYTLLEVDPSASIEKIGKQFRKLSRTCHPDSKTPNEELFTRINQAYLVLSDPIKRRIYDQVGEAGLEAGLETSGDSGSGADAVRGFVQGQRARAAFAARFGGGWDADRKAPTAGPWAGDAGVGGRANTQIQHLIRLTTSQMFHGGKKHFQVKRNIWNSERNEWNIEELNLEVRIRPGVTDGHQVQIRGSGHQSATGAFGDLVVIFREVRDTPMERLAESPQDLHYHCQINLYQSLFGFWLELPHPDGSTHRIHRMQTTQPGSSQTYEGKGMPIYQTPERRGNLIVHFVVRLPERVTELESAHQLQRMLQALPSEPELPEEHLDDWDDNLSELSALSE